MYGQQFEKHQYIKQKDTLPYRLLLPENYNPLQSYPLLVFLHGAGERGNDNEKQLLHGSDLFTSEKFRKSYPAIVVFPQCSENSYWASVKKSHSRKKEKRFKFHKKPPQYSTIELLKAFLVDVNKQFNIDSSRRYIGGLSMGGMGTFELVSQLPDYFASAFSICGGGHPRWSKKLSNTPFWIFHGNKDFVVSHQYSEKMFKKMHRYNSSTKLTIYESVGHNSWDRTFKEPDLFHWLFSFVK